MRSSARIVHHILGQRMRVRVSDPTPTLLNEIRNRVQRISGVRSVNTNPTTGSILIVYSSEAPSDFCRALFGQVTDLIRLTTDSSPEIGDYSSTAVNLLSVIKQSDDQLRSKTGGSIDLKLLFPAAVVGLAALTLPTNLQTPLWLSFLMFGFSCFESMHTGALEQPTGKAGAEHESDAAAGASQG